jgi:hypothetical protein
MAWISSEFCLTCVEIKFYGAFVLNRRVDLHAIDATPARWRGDAGSSLLDRARTAACAPTHGLISTQSLTMVSPHLVAEGVPSLSVCWFGTAQIWGSSRCVATDEFERQAVNLHCKRSVSKKLRPITVISCPPFWSTYSGHVRKTSTVSFM